MEENNVNGKNFKKLVVVNTINWLEKAVIGLNLCPFAKAVHVRQQISFVVSEARDIELLTFDLIAQLNILANTDSERIDTILLIHPFVLDDFLDYNDFLYLADQTLENHDLDGNIQIASFHPDYRFAGTKDDAIENYTNRSPYPMLHLLREASVDRAIAAFPNAEEIYEKNIETMTKLTLAGWKALFNR